MTGSSWRLAALCAACVLAAISGCSGGSSGSAGAGGCTQECQSPQNFLTEADVQRIIAQAVGEAQARSVRGTVAVVDRVGNVLAIFKMNGAPAFIAISSGVVNSAGQPTRGGLDGVPTGIVPATFSAIAKAVTGAYLSSEGNAFTTRTASQIIQEHFNPNESQQASGPLYGVQFSSLTCSDVVRNTPTHGRVGPHRTPLGLSADPGGLPLYKNGTVVGGIGVEANGLYTLDREFLDVEQDDEELVAVAGTFGFAAPVDRRADRITAGGRTLRFVDSEALASNPATPPAFATLPGSLVAVPDYADALVHAGTAFGTAASGIRPATNLSLAAQGAHVLVDSSGAERFAPRASADGQLSARDVEVILTEGLKIANRGRAQIRRPLGSPIHVSLTVVGSNGDILGLARTADGPVFGIDVSAQKARGALFISHPLAGALLIASPGPDDLAVDPAGMLGSVPGPTFASYVTATRAFLADPAALTGNTAWSMRAIGNIHRPFFPDGIDTAPNGPLSTPYSNWSPFNVGFQLDLVFNQLIKSIAARDLSEGCVGRDSLFRPVATPDPRGISLARNGIQIFPGGVPIYRAGVLVGAFGISGDGVDQDDMIAFLGLANASAVLANGVGHAPRAIRADTLRPLGTQLRYVQCPQAPFNDSTEQNPCGDF